MNTKSGPRTSFRTRVPGHWENYWSGAGDQAEARDAAVTGAARSEAFQSAWRVFFETINSKPESHMRGLRLKDLACGAGVVTDNAISVLAPERLAQTRLIGVDYSVSAARKYSTKYKSSGVIEAFGVVADAMLLPFESRSADVAVSQFGLEYAGPAAVADAGRLAAAGGEIMCLAHRRSGAIEVECRENLRIVEEILSSEVFAHARELFVRQVDTQITRRLTDVLTNLRSVADQSSDSAGKRLLSRLGADVMRLVSRRAAFDPSEAIGWLDASAAETSMYADRMRAMIGAALDAGQVGNIIEHWKAENLDIETPAEIRLEGAPLPSAWRLRARRSKD